MSDETPADRMKRIEAEYLMPPLYRQTMREAMPAMQLEVPAAQHEQARALLATLEAQVRVLSDDRRAMIDAFRDIHAKTNATDIRAICERVLIEQGEKP